MTLSISFAIPIHFLHIWYFSDNNNIELCVIKSFIEYNKVAAAIMYCAIDNGIALLISNGQNKYYHRRVRPHGNFKVTFNVYRLRSIDNLKVSSVHKMNQNLQV